MSCCGNNKVDQLKQIYNTTLVAGPSNPFNNGNLKPVVGKGSPFDNYVTEYKPVMSSNGKFVKYVRESKTETEKEKKT